MSKYLPTQPNLRQLRNQAKDLVKAHGAGNPDAVRRIGVNLPRLSVASEDAILSGSFALQEAQHVIAKEYGFPSWKLLAAYAKTEPTNDSRYRSYLPDKEAGAMERAEAVVWHMAMDEHRTRNSVVRYQADVDVGTDEWDLRVHKIIRVRTWETPEEKETTNSYSVMDFILDFGHLPRFPYEGRAILNAN